MPTKQPKKHKKKLQNAIPNEKSTQTDFGLLSCRPSMAPLTAPKTKPATGPTITKDSILSTPVTSVNTAGARKSVNMSFH